MVPASWSPPTTILLLPRNSWVSGIRKDADGRWGKVGDYEFRFYENIGRAGVWKMRSGERESYGKLGPNGVKMVCEAKKGGMGDWVARWRRWATGWWKRWLAPWSTKGGPEDRKGSCEKDSPRWKAGCGWGKLGFSRDPMTQKSWWFKPPETRKRAGFICIKQWKQNVRCFITLTSEPGIGLQNKKGLCPQGF